MSAPPPILPDDPVPPDWIAQLRAAAAHPGFAAPASLDDSVLNAASPILRRRRWSRRAFTAAPLAAAAGLALAVALWPTFTQSPSRRSSPLTAAVGHDLNTDGRIDMLDALVLARALSGTGAGRDLTGDGAIDQHDVDALAGEAVRLDRRPT